ncbi:uncharacterized protein BXZ73DRAFT_99466 [Epithele typhae]|uniref:uncharacterized protein n=1 Tax=Epithele typhae TaxID=378194 RepID=UPI00200880E9|nr:uncharacterized protein BXZ73DRAFT_99466 [Epithele typhae]KAH9939263.1 hypothetical protein BXZ73DRAFT_99466 [Epithele typhae]
MTAMELMSLPFDVLQPILELSCTDGGFTGCSLSCTSRTLRDLSRVARFWSIQLTFATTTLQLEHFLACLSAERSRAVTDDSPAPRVRHLYLSTNTLSDLAPADSYAKVLPDDYELLKFHDEVRTLMDLVARDLHTLTLAGGPRLRPLCLPRWLGTTEFPALRELTLLGPLWSIVDFAPLPLEDASPEELEELNAVPYPSLPNLRRLEVFASVKSAMNLDRWSSRAPRLTHLRITNAETVWLDTDMLGRIVGTGEDLTGCPRLGGTLFPHLQAFLVQPFSRLPRCGPNHILESRGISASVQTAHRESAHAWALLPPAPPYLKETEIDRRKARLRGWYERLEGEPGRWETEDEWFARD